MQASSLHARTAPGRSTTVVRTQQGGREAHASGRATVGLFGGVAHPDKAMGSVPIFSNCCTNPLDAGAPGEVTGTLYMGAFVARLVAMYSGGRQGPDGEAV